MKDTHLIKNFEMKDAWDEPAVCGSWDSPSTTVREAVTCTACLLLDFQYKAEGQE
jgi:hypothetical protein